jgi:hypothetical protein
MDRQTAQRQYLRDGESDREREKRGEKESDRERGRETNSQKEIDKKKKLKKVLHIFSQTSSLTLKDEKRGKYI